MTEQESFKYLLSEAIQEINENGIIEDMEELNKYRLIGTVKECRKAMEIQKCTEGSRMTENEAIEILKKRKECDLRVDDCIMNCWECDLAISDKVNITAAYDTAITALKEIQRYRDIGNIDQTEEQR